MRRWPLYKNFESMLKNRLKKILAFTLCALPGGAIAMQGINGEFVVGFGPVSLGEVSMTSSCEGDTCHYKTRAKGSFLFISADINEHGTYKQNGKRIVPIFTSYEEEIGSKHKAYTYDFLAMEITNTRKKKQKKLPQIAYPSIPLLNQVALDLSNGGMKDQYEYLLKQKIKPVTAASHKKTEIEKGILHKVDVEASDSILEVFFVQNGDGIQLEKVRYGSFWLSHKKPPTQIN